MKINRKTIGISTTILCLMVVFSLLFLPWALLGISREEPHNAKEPLLNLPKHQIEVYRTQLGMTELLELENYVKGVVAGEMPSSFEEEALKAQAVAARTYAVSKIIAWKNGRQAPQHTQIPLCDSTHCQVYRSPKELEKLKSEEWMKTGWKKIEAAVEETEGQVLYYQGTLVDQPLFHSSSGGKTENSEAVFASAVPYLRSVSSAYEPEATHQNEVTNVSPTELSKKLKGKYPNRPTGTITASNVVVTSRSQGGRVERVQIGKSSFSGREVREALNLSSANFTVGMEGGSISFVTVGYGHGVGMSQYGANGMAEKGYDYEEILAHYYSGVTVVIMQGI